MRGCDLPVFDGIAGLCVSVGDSRLTGVTPRRIIYRGTTEVKVVVFAGEPIVRLHFDGLARGSTGPTVSYHEVPLIVVPTFEFHFPFPLVCHHR